MPVIYDGKKIIPACFVQLSKSYNTAGDGRKIGSFFSISLEGKLCFDRGSPNSTGVFWTNTGYPADETIAADSALTSLLRKQEALRDLFADEGKTLEVQGYDGGASMKCNPRFKNIEFRRGQTTSWVTTIDYLVSLEADIVSVNGLTLGEDDTDDVINYHIERTDESWNMEAADEIGRTFRLSHQLNAKGKRFYDETGTLVQQAWQNAKDYVLNKITLGIDLERMIASGVLNESNLQAYNYLKSQNVNEMDGSFGVNETWLCFDPGTGVAAIEEFNVNTTINEASLVDVRIDGTIRGLEVRNNSSGVFISSRWQNAVLKFSGEVEPVLAARAQNISGYSLNTNPLSKTIGRNQINGVITYNYGYNNRPSSSVPGAISEVITIGYENQADVFAEIPIIGRAAGPILQDIGTRTSKKKNLTIEAVVPASSQTVVASEPDTDAIVTSYAPSATQVFKSRDSRSFSPSTGRVSRSVSWTYE